MATRKYQTRAKHKVTSTSMSYRFKHTLGASQLRQPEPRTPRHGQPRQTFSATMLQSPGKNNVQFKLARWKSRCCV